MIGRLRRRRLTLVAFCATTSLLLGAAVAVTASAAAAADASTKYLGIFRESAPMDTATGTTSRYGVTPASVQWFDSWATGNTFDSAAARALWSRGIVAAPELNWLR
jgi:hypothetical protein